MMLLVMMALLSYVALVLETGCGTWSLPVGTMPQFIFLTAAVAVLTYRGAGAILWAVIAGLFADVVHGGPLGLNAVLLANLSFFAQTAGARKWKDSILTSAAFILLYVAFAGFGSVTVQEILTAQIPDFVPLGASAVSRAGGTVAAYLLVMVSWGMLLRSTRLIIPRRTVSPDRPRWAQ